jgi:hypothetical protein
MDGLEMSSDILAARERATYAPLDNPDRRHEPDGVVPLPDKNPDKVTGFHETGTARHEARMILPTDPAERKNLPICTGVLDYFPRALAEVARVSKAGSDQHHPGQPLHWEKGKSTDHADCIARHLLDRFSRDSDGQRHAAKLAWRALALLETLLEAEQ